MWVGVKTGSPLFNDVQNPTERERERAKFLARGEWAPTSTGNLLNSTKRSHKVCVCVHMVCVCVCVLLLPFLGLFLLRPPLAQAERWLSEAAA